MKAVILAGGQGTRLRPITENIPKPMVHLLGKPMMEHIVGHLRGHGFNDLLVTLHYRPRIVRDHFGDGGDFAVNMQYTLEREPRGTAGSIKLGEEFLNTPFLVIAGDALTDFDLGAFWRFHQASGAKISLCLKRVADPGEFGVVVADEQGRIQRFQEKPGVSEVCSDTVNTGIYLIEPDILAEIPADQPYDFASDLFPKLLARSVPLFAYVADGYWSDIGTLEQLKQSHWDWLDGKVRLPLSGNLVQDRVWVGDGARVDAGAELVSPCWIGDNARVRQGAKIGPYTVICPNAEVDVRATVVRGIVMNNAFVGEASDLRNCIIGNDSVVETHCSIADEAVIGARCHLGQDVTIMPGVLVWPDKEVDGKSILRENLVWESLARPSIFGSRGVNGLANLHITPEYAVALGKAFGTWTGRGVHVTVARDTHPFSRLIKRAFVAGLLAVGVNVDDLEDVSLPEARFITAFSRSTGGGAHIRMSDEHASVAVIEMFDADGLPLVRQVRRKIEAVFFRGEFPRVAVDRVGNLAYPGRVDERYEEHMMQHIKPGALAPWRDKTLYYCQESNLARILVEILSSSRLPTQDDCADETAAIPYERIAEIAKLNHKIAIIVERKGEQLTLVDEVGAILRPKRTLELLAAAFIISAKSGEPVFLQPDRPRFLIELAESRVRGVVITHKDPGAQLSTVREQANIEGAWLHWVHFYLGYGAVAGVLRLLEFLGKEQLTLHDFERQIPVSYQRALRIPCPWSDMGRVMRELSEHADNRRENLPEGVRLQLDSGCAYVLPSSDAPHLEISLEAENAAGLAQLEQDAVHYVRSLTP